MYEYEILIEWVGGYAGEGQMQKKLVEAKIANPEDYVRENDNWPLFDSLTLSNGDFVIITQSGEGNIRRYTFMKC